jgi:hypothetical protein
MADTLETSITVMARTGSPIASLKLKGRETGTACNENLFI